MVQDRRSWRALIALLPAGALGLSIGLAAADAPATPAPDGGRASADESQSVARRLLAIRLSVSQVLSETAGNRSDLPETRLAEWGNGGWHNGGWGNGGWHNGGWGNGWHNGGWGNGGLLNNLVQPFVNPCPWGYGWLNGWRNG